MAGSRLENFGSVFSRVTGLLRSGAMKHADKPLWYDVYASFPPHKPDTKSNQEKKAPINILYKEDMIRAKFYSTYGNPDMVDLQNSTYPSLSQRFVVKYNELRDSGVGEESVFQAASEALKSEGVRLRTLEEIKQDQEAARQHRRELAKAKQAASLPTADQVFGTETVATDPQHEGDTLDESLDDPGKR